MYFRWMACALLGVAAAGAPAQAKDIVIGSEVGVTGTYSFVGVPARDAMAIALDEINASGMFGADKIVLDVQDTGSDKGQAISLMSRFADRDQAIMVIGPSSSNEGLAIAPVANALKIPLLSATAISGGVNASGPWAFRTPASPAALTGEIAKYDIAHFQTKTAALVGARDNDAQINQKDAGGKYFRDHGVTIVADDTVLTTDTDYLALVTKLASLQPDAILLALTAEQSANFIVQARQAGIDPKVRFLGVPNMGASQFISVGGDAVEGATFVADYFAGSPVPENQKFVATFQARYGHLPDNFASLGYTALKLAAHAIKDAGPNPTRESVRDALARIRTFPSILGTGEFSFDDNRGGTYTGAILTVSKGKFVLAPQ